MSWGRGRAGARRRVASGRGGSCFYGLRGASGGGY
uniref:Uncharacterized protein n=1 Tax=Arundo donax TaxID=35708 RepID=A0A0A9BBL9_ARUDO